MPKVEVPLYLWVLFVSSFWPQSIWRFGEQCELPNWDGGEPQLEFSAFWPLSLTSSDDDFYDICKKLLSESG